MIGFLQVLVAAAANAPTAAPSQIQAVELLCRLVGGTESYEDYPSGEIHQQPVSELSDKHKKAFQMKLSLIKIGEKKYFEISFVNNNDLFKISGLHAVKPQKEGKFWIADINNAYGDRIKVLPIENGRIVYFENNQDIVTFYDWDALESECVFKP